MVSVQRSRALLVSFLAAQVFLSALPAAAAAPADGSARTPSFTDEWWSEYHATADVFDLMKTVAAEHRDIVKLFSVGTTHESRSLLVAKVSDNPNIEEAQEPDVLIIAGTHAREWTTYHAAAYLLNYLTGHYRRTVDGALQVAAPGVMDNDSYASWLVDNREIYILVMVNPDGIEYTHTTDNLWRKNREPNAGVLGYFCTGTDINRNFDWHWGELTGDSHNPCSEVYAGPSDARTSGYTSLFGWRPGEPYPGGFSTAEARAIRDLQLAHNFKTALSLHSYSGLVLYPWGHTSDPSPDDADFVRMADVMANMTGYTPMQGYELYKTAGVWDDWSYGITGAYSFTIEMGSEFQPPTPEILNQSQLVLGPELYLAEVADDLHLTAPSIEVVNAPSAEVEANRPTTVTARVDAVNGLAEGEVVLVYSRDGGATWSERPMAPRGDGVYFVGEVPGLRPGGSALYFVRATDSDGITRSGPKAAPYQAFEVHARNGLLDQIGDFGLIAILTGAGLAGALLYIKFLRGRGIPRLPNLPKMPRWPGVRGRAARAKPADAPLDEAGFELAVATRPGLQRFLERGD